MQVTREIVVGAEPFAEIVIGKSYKDAAGMIHKRAEDAKGPDGKGKYEIQAKYLFKLGLPSLTPEDKENAVMGHYTRKAQEFFSVMAEDADVDALAAKFVAETYLARLRQEKAERGARIVDTKESLALRILVKVLRDKSQAGQIAGAKFPVPRADNPPVDKNGKTNFSAWAKILKEEGHKWYEGALKKAGETEKGFE